MSSITQSIEPSGPKPRKWFAWENVLVYGFLIITAAYWLFPLYIVIITSFKDLVTIRDGNIFMPQLHYPIVEVT